MEPIRKCNLTFRSICRPSWKRQARFYVQLYLHFRDELVCIQRNIMKWLSSKSLCASSKSFMSLSCSGVVSNVSGSGSRGLLSLSCSNSSVSISSSSNFYPLSTCMPTNTLKHSWTDQKLDWFCSNSTIRCIKWFRIEITSKNE